MQKARSHPPRTRRYAQAPTACMHTVSGSFHSPSGVLFTFPSRYSALSVMSSYLALEDGPPRFNRNSSCSGLLGYPGASLLAFRIRDSHPLWCAFPGTFRYAFGRVLQGPTTPARFDPHGFGLFPVRSPLLRESLLISLPPGTEMFQFPGLASLSG